MSDVARAIVAVVAQAQEQPRPACEFCGDDGWYVGHEDECYDTGDCHCSGIQVQCECAGESS